MGIELMPKCAELRKVNQTEHVNITGQDFCSLYPARKPAGIIAVAYVPELATSQRPSSSLDDAIIQKTLSPNDALLVRRRANGSL
ncbi:uncharacterized protein LAJ45_01883 [Morchella importuna]|uniref:uncharacterized protein n=1 Tax=Morchella importuna TaxID=1174673 RepID=UPI001E8D4804|nr:uncharacterized protein LAJ45_01883 [Morchella importuna]KAH8154115.1 hypothetical protein LAJ45_01883 [Morchella importuna]